MGTRTMGYVHLGGESQLPNGHFYDIGFYHLSEGETGCQQCPSLPRPLVTPYLPTKV